MDMRRSLDYRSQSHSLLSTSPGSYSNLGGLNSLGTIPRPCSRRGSFLYRTDVSDGGDMSPTQRSRQSSLVPHDVGSTDQQDILVVTPFAQLINSLRSVRNNYTYLHDIPHSRKSSSSQCSSPTSNSIDEIGRKRIVQETLQELDWCLEQLEGIQTLKSAGHVAARKFKRILSRELTQYSQFSKDGARMSDYISRTFLDTDDYGGSDHLPGITDVVNEASPAPVTPELSSPTVPELYSPVSSISRISGLRTSSSPVMDNQSKIPNLGVNVPNAEFLEQNLRDINEWGLDLFRIAELSNNRPLTVVTFKILKGSGLLKTLHIAEYELVNYLTQLENHYRADNPYHNATHAADVTQSVNVLLRLPSLQNVFSDLEVLAAIFAAAVHDVDHPGFTNQFLINTNAELALMYNDEAVLENHHAAVAFKLLHCQGCDLFKNLSSKQRQSVRRMVIGMVLATDMSKHMDHIANLKTMVEMYQINSGVTKLLLKDNKEDKIQILQTMVHCADLSNPTKPGKLYRRWTNCIMAEFFRQGDEEKRLGLPVSPMCDREQASVGHSQIGFIDYIVYPLWESLAELVNPDCQYILDTLDVNRQSHVTQSSEDRDSENEPPTFITPKVSISPS